MLRRHANLARVLAIAGALITSACKQPDADRAAASSSAAPATAQKQAPGPVRCFDLPGAARHGFTLSPDSKRLAFVETLPGLASEAARFHLRILDLEKGSAANVTREPFIRGGSPEFADGRIVMAISPEALGDRNLFAIQSDGAMQMLNEPETFVLAYGTGGSPARAIYAGLQPGNSKAGVPIWSVALDGTGRAKTATEGMSLLAVTSDAQLIVRNPAGETEVLGPGNARRKIGEKNAKVRDLGEWLIVEEKQAAGNEVRWLLSAADEALKLPLEKDDEVVSSGRSAFVKRRAGKSIGLLEAVGRQLQPRLEVRGPDIAGAWRLDETRTLVAVVHDTNGDTRYEVGEDEIDICVIDAKGVVDVPTRTVPRARLGEMDYFIAAVQRIVGATTSVRFSSRGTLLVVEVPSLPTDAAPLRETVRRLGSELLSATRDTLDGVIFRAPNDREGLYTRVDAGKFRHVFTGAYGVLTADPADYAVSVDSKATARAEFFDVVDVRCTGTVKNLGAASIPAVSVLCRAGPPDNLILAKRTEAIQKIELGDLAPGASKKFDIKIAGRALNGITAFGNQLSVRNVVQSAGATLTSYDTVTSDDNEDFISIVSALAREPYGLMPKGSVLADKSSPQVLHGHLHLSSPRPLSLEDRTRLATVLRDKTKKHVERFHKGENTAWFTVRSPDQTWLFDGKQLVSQTTR